MQVTKTIRAFGGEIHKLTHESAVLQCDMSLNVFLPPQPAKAPVLYYLAGLTCTGDNGLEKGGFLGPATEHNIALVFPDTSPRTASELVAPNGVKEHADWDFGSGAGFYLNATQSPWNEHYRMEDYILQELPQLLARQYPQLDFSAQSVFGHSMGGHGALTLFLKNRGAFRSVSAFAPIAHPTNCRWGQKAFREYLGSLEAGEKYDASCLLARADQQKLDRHAILVDQGLGDQFYQEGQLQPESLVAVGGDKVKLRKHDGYDHSYFFVSTFAQDHIEHHAKFLRP